MTARLSRRATSSLSTAWEFFGGIFRVLIPDNTKTIVINADPLAARITPPCLEYAAPSVAARPPAGGMGREQDFALTDRACICQIAIWW